MPVRRKSSSNASLDGFCATPEQQADFNRHMAMACITACVPFSFFANEHVLKAAAVFGAKLASPKVLSTTLLDSIFKEVQVATSTNLDALSYIDGSSDGWRKKSCLLGAGLMNFCALTVTGALFWDAINCSTMRKDGEAIAALLDEQACLMTADNPARFAGWLLDNTKANWAAMGLLQEKYPDWIMRGCNAHGLSLAMKDFTVFTNGAHPTQEYMYVGFFLSLFLSLCVCLRVCFVTSKYVCMHVCKYVCKYVCKFFLCFFFCVFVCLSACLFCHFYVCK